MWCSWSAGACPNAGQRGSIGPGWRLHAPRLSASWACDQRAPMSQQRSDDAWWWSPLRRKRSMASWTAPHAKGAPARQAAGFRI